MDQEAIQAGSQLTSLQKNNNKKLTSLHELSVHITLGHFGIVLLSNLFCINMLYPCAFISCAQDILKWFSVLSSNTLLQRRATARHKAFSAGHSKVLVIEIYLVSPIQWLMSSVVVVLFL